MNGIDVVAYCQRCGFVQGPAVWAEYVGDGFVAAFVCPGCGTRIVRYCRINGSEEDGEGGR